MYFCYVQQDKVWQVWKMMRCSNVLRLLLSVGAKSRPRISVSSVEWFGKLKCFEILLSGSLSCSSFRWILCLIFLMCSPNLSLSCREVRQYSSCDICCRRCSRWCLKGQVKGMQALSHLWPHICLKLWKRIIRLFYHAIRLSSHKRLVFRTGSKFYNQHLSMSINLLQSQVF